jgi:serine acetyltransferase
MALARTDAWRFEHTVTRSRNPRFPGLWQLIREDWQAHGRDWTKPGFRAIAIHRFGVWRMRLRPKLLRAPFSVLYRCLYRRIRNHYGIDLPYSAKLGRRVIIEHCGAIVIHGNCIIGDECIIRQGVTMGMRSMDRPLEVPELGARVDVGAGAKILGKVRIEDRVQIGANAVVLADLPAGSIAVGIPARLVSLDQEARAW